MARKASPACFLNGSRKSLSIASGVSKPAACASCANLSGNWISMLVMSNSSDPTSTPRGRAAVTANRKTTGSSLHLKNRGLSPVFARFSHPDEEELDPDGLDQSTRMAVENQAIDKIIAWEPSLKRTPDGNPGFDLYETDATGKPIRWVEVKSMTGSLSDRPVGLSRTQFDCARERGAAYWLYVVEHATNADQARILRIEGPVTHARTFTFDRGWAEIAETEAPD